MSKVLTVTFSPAIDKSSTVPSLLPEKKLRCTEPVLDPGGGGVNVARAMIKLGGLATALYPAGGYTGKFFIQLLEKEQVPSIVVETEAYTRENFVITDVSSNQQYRFGMPGTPLTEKEWKKMLEEIEKFPEPDYIVASGSLPPGVPTDIFGQIAQIAKKNNARFIADTSGDALIAAANEGVYLLKPNLSELSTLAGKKYVEVEEVDDAARKIIEKGNCEVVVVSLGAAGAQLVSRETEKRIVSPKVKTMTTVGAGDSMVGGIVYALTKGMDLTSAVQYGVACGTAATMNAGTSLFKPADVHRLFDYMKKVHA